MTGYLNGVKNNRLYSIHRAEESIYKPIQKNLIDTKTESMISELEENITIMEDLCQTS